MTNQSKYIVPNGVPIDLLDTKLNHTFTFIDSENKEIARLDFNGSKMTFTGDADEAGKIFFDCIAQYFEARLKEERNNALKEAIEIAEAGFKRAKDGDEIADDIRALLKSQNVCAINKNDASDVIM